MVRIENKSHLAYQVENKCYNIPTYDWNTYFLLFSLLRMTGRSKLLASKGIQLQQHYTKINYIPEKINPLWLCYC
jgi:hypothetical protein